MSSENFLAPLRGFDFPIHQPTADAVGYYRPLLRNSWREPPIHFFHPMNALVRKEIRLLLPVWIAALLQAVLPALFCVAVFDSPPPEIVICAPFGFGVLLLGLSSFGYEFGAGTFSILLAQPIPRIQIWQMKTRLLALSLASVWLACVAVNISLHPRWVDNGLASDPFILLTLLTVVAFPSVLWTTLLFRQVSAAFWFSILVPSFISVFSFFALEKQSENLAFVVVSIILLLYSAAGFFWARWMFLRAQDTAWTGGEVALPAWLGFGKKIPVRAVVPKLKPLRALVHKEIQSHHFTLLIGAGLLATHLIGIVVRKLEYDPTNSHKTEVFGFWWLLWFALPLIIGSTIVAEERKSGTLESHLCLPVKRGWQFLVKFVVALLLGVFLGGVMPAICEGLASWAGVPGEFPSAANPGLGTWMTICCLIATGIVLVSMYASTMTRNLLQALGTAVLTGMGLSAFGAAVMAQSKFYWVLWEGFLGAYIGVPVMVVALVWLSFKNFKSLQVGVKLWVRNFFAVVAAMVLIVLSTALVWNRVWELGMTLEPAHGPARLTGSVRPDLNFVWGGKVFALLPDGRIWLENQFQNVEDRYNFNVPTGGYLLTTSNSIQLASSYRSLVGLAADGNLWNLFRTNKTNYQANLSSAPDLRRIGTDSDWKMVVPGLGGFVSLKQDGTLWTGTNEFQLPFQLGHDSDWTAIFGSTFASAIGVKRDGSWLPFGASGFTKDWKPEHPEPNQFYPAGGNWRTIANEGSFDLLIKDDGSLWVCGNLPENILGKPVYSDHPASRFSAVPVKIKNEPQVVEMTSGWGSGNLSVLLKDGTIYNNDLNLYERILFFRGTMAKLSQHSDWIAIAHDGWNQSIVALAADGTLTAWGNPMNRLNSEHPPLLGPSRKPIWTLSIFTENK